MLVVLDGAPEDFERSDARPEDPPGPEPRLADSAGEAGPAESRDRTAYYEALCAADERQRASWDSGDRPERPTTAWDDPPTADHPSRPAPDSIRPVPERVEHILDGDEWGGGHRSGTGRPGKTEFLPDWDDEQTIGHIMDVARSPEAGPVWQPNQRWRVHGVRDGVGINVVIKPDGQVWSAWPDEGSPGVIRNPTEGQQ